VTRETREKGAVWTDWVLTSFGQSCSSRLSRSAILRWCSPLVPDVRAMEFQERRNSFSAACRRNQCVIPHYSWALLLQSPIRCYDELPAGGLAPRPLTVLHDYASGPQGSARWSRNAAQQFRDGPSW